MWPGRSPTDQGWDGQYAPPNYPPEYNQRPQRHSLPGPWGYAYGFDQYPMPQPQPQSAYPHPSGLVWQRPAVSASADHRYLIPTQGSSAALATTASQGPPLKPRRSGYAIWVGNLRPQTTILEVKDHFARGAGDEIESVFLISRSNCAFVNYRTEEACRSALIRFSSSRLNGNILAVRLRRDPGAGKEDFSPNSPQESTGPVIVGARRTSDSSSQRPSLPSKIPAKYFVLKSLSVEDLQISVKKGTWVTQTHNEETLNLAYKEAQNVYLFFSANKSGEYFGVARMASALSDRPEHISESRTEPPIETTQPQSPKYIMTDASSTAPKGRIMNDTARGTLFWEAVPEKEDESGDLARQVSGEQHPGMGKVFDVEWLSTVRLPFFRTRGLRNAWNANREVKIARDGTEIEEQAGKRLLDLFMTPPEPAGVTLYN